MKPEKKILVAEDDNAVRKSLERALRLEGYQVLMSSNGEQALEIASVTPPDLYILDVMMPILDGLSVCRTLRRQGDKTPILILTARHQVSDRVSGLDAGADDYLAKPFALDELLARIRALLRRNASDTKSKSYVVSNLVLNIETRQVLREGRELDLTKTEFDLLELLMRNENVVLTREMIYDEIWGFDFETNSKSLDVYVGYLRRKVDNDPSQKLIHTIRGIGYCLRK
ncbi:MAG: DNA-binding response regulator [Acidimicrobiaceae bacterium TMED77]|nr:response regulator transcription factor [Acidimicrobiales bacterium]OUV01622.1 MAG: DNA-binding response regulator [Acidimicrobiaceae bacterium TMED77]